MESGDRDVAEFLLQHLDADREGKVDDELVAALVEGRLDDEMRDRVEAALAQDAEGRALAAAWADARPAQVKRPRFQPLVWASAAVLLVGVGALLWHMETGQGRGAARTFEQVAASLRAGAPELLADLKPLTVEELEAGTEAPVRGTLRALRPAFTVLPTRPTFEWTAAPGAEAYRVTVVDASGREIASETVQGTTWVPHTNLFAAGASYVWEVRAVGGILGDGRASRTFEVADQVLQVRWQAACDRIGEESPADLVDVLRAHLAIRWKLIEEAERLLRKTVRTGADRKIVFDTLAYVERRMGRA